MRQLGIFAKFWEPGRVKTRLAATIGSKSAAALYRAFVLTSLRRLGQGHFGRAQLADRLVCVLTPSEQRPAFETLLAECFDGEPAGTSHPWVLEDQAGGDLGARMRHYFASTPGGVTQAILVGSDSPHLPPSIILQAFTLLESHDLVLGPTTDGGYYLIGSRLRTPDVFTGIAWSTDRVWSQTVDRAEAAGHTWAMLPEGYDIDQVSDLKRLSADLVDEVFDTDLISLRRLVTELLKE